VGSFFYVHTLDILIQIFLSNWRSLQILLVNLFILSWIWHLKGWLEDVDAVERSADEQFEVDGMVAHFLDLLLTLVQEHQLVGNIRLFLLVLNCHVPDGQSVVLGSHCDHRFLVGLETDGGDGLSVPVEAEQLVL
jgi:hypothetical protein